MPALLRTSSRMERKAPSISFSEQDGTHFLNSDSEKYLLIVYRFFESTYLYYLCHCSKLTELSYFVGAFGCLILIYRSYLQDQVPVVTIFPAMLVNGNVRLLSSSSVTGLYPLISILSSYTVTI